MDEDGVTIMGSLHMIPHAQYIPRVMEWLQQEPEEILWGPPSAYLMGASSIMMTFLLNSGVSLKENELTLS